MPNCYRCGDPATLTCPHCGKHWCNRHDDFDPCGPNVFAQRQIVLRPHPSQAALVQPCVSMFQYSDPTFLLGTLAGPQLGRWAAGKATLAGAHHVFPKSVLAWLFDHMTALQQSAVKRSLGLSQQSSAKALARLRSNLISPQDQKMVIRPEMRADDPHHHGGSGILGEEYLDLIRTQGGHLEPRSLAYRTLALFVIHVLYPRFHKNPNGFVIKDAEAEVILHLVLRAESIHYYVEQDPLSPAYGGGNFWHRGASGFRKGMVPEVKLPSNRELFINYRVRKEREMRDQAAAAAAARAAHEQPNYPRWGPARYAAKSERLGGFGGGGFGVGNGHSARGRMIARCRSQLEVDLVAAIDSAYFATFQRNKPWGGGDYADIQRLAEALLPFWEVAQQRAFQAWKSGKPGSHDLLPKIVIVLDGINAIITIAPYKETSVKHKLG